MKQLILITAMLVAMTTKVLAQEKAIEIKNLPAQPSTAQQETHQFEIVANENVDVNLKFSLKSEDNVNVLVTDTKDKVVFSKRYHKQGENKLEFTMEENEKYTVMLNGEKQSNLIVTLSED